MNCARCIYILFSVVSLVFCACSRAPETTTPIGGLSAPKSMQVTDGPGVMTLKATLATLNLANPIRDLEANLAKQDRHFIGTNGYTCWAPGIDDSVENHRLVNSSAYGLNCLAGTSDALESDEHLALVNIAEAYAKAYNFELMRRIRFSPLIEIFQLISRALKQPVITDRSGSRVLIR